jgi:hypothetical protein
MNITLPQAAVNRRTMIPAKNIVYSYADKREFDELEVDMTGELSFKKGDIITRNWRTWKVESIHLHTEAEDAASIPTLWVLLVNAPVN